jgi:hypothetical protein
MEPVDLGHVIAERQLQYDHPEHGPRIVRVLLGTPSESPGGVDWYCPWQVVGIGDEQVRAAYGIDAFQWLQLVMKTIGATLYAQTDQGSRLSWIDGSTGFGFP